VQKSPELAQTPPLTISAKVAGQEGLFGPGGGEHVPCGYAVTQALFTHSSTLSQPVFHQAFPYSQ
jgi:hypothetical protein